MASRRRPTSLDAHQQGWTIRGLDESNVDNACLPVGVHGVEGLGTHALTLFAGHLPYEYQSCEPWLTIEEVLPLIPANTDIKQAYKDLRLTKNPDGRGSIGGSSGGAAAFTMGWFRPDLYRRILTYSGTFLKQGPDAKYPNGAWEYHQHLIAEGAKKPLRVFLEVGENDLNLDPLLGDGMHSWVAGNRGMAAALKAKSYDYRFVYALGAAHVDDGAVGQTLPDALRWVWRGYPIP